MVTSATSWMSPPIKAPTEAANFWFTPKFWGKLSSVLLACKAQTQRCQMDTGEGVKEKKERSSTSQGDHLLPFPCEQFRVTQMSASGTYWIHVDNLWDKYAKTFVCGKERVRENRDRVREKEGGATGTHVIRSCW